MPLYRSLFREFKQYGHSSPVTAPPKILPSAATARRVFTLFGLKITANFFYTSPDYDLKSSQWGMKLKRC